MDKFLDCWYWCEIEDGDEATVKEPDWSRIPEVKRAHVRERWLAANKDRLEPERWKMWGPQIPWYQAHNYQVKVIGPVDGPAEVHEHSLPPGFHGSA